MQIKYFSWLKILTETLMYEIYWSTATYYENFRKKILKGVIFSTIDVKDSIRFEIILINAFAWFYILSDQKFLSGMKYLLKNRLN